MESNAEEIERLAKLRDKGELTNEEFESLKARLLGTKPPSSGPSKSAITLVWVAVAVIGIGILARTFVNDYQEDQKEERLADERRQAEIRDYILDNSACALESEGRPLIREWNSVSGELLAFYMDRSVSPDQYVVESERLLPRLNRVVQDLEALPDCLPADEQAFFAPILVTYRDKFSGYATLETAVHVPSPELEQIAIEILENANLATQRILCDLPPDLLARLSMAPAC